MTVSLTDIRTAIAARCATVSGIEEATASQLQGVANLPCVKVTNVTSFGLDGERGGRYYTNDCWNWTVNADLLVKRSADLGTAMAEVEPYITGIITAFYTGFGLGLSYVVDSWLDSGTVGGLHYAGEDYIGAKLTFVVQTKENVVNRSLS